MFELYVIKDDLKVNPIPEKAKQLRSQAIDGNGLCDIKIPAFINTINFLDTVKASVTGSACAVSMCRSTGCLACFHNSTCVECLESTNCDGQKDIKEYKNCDCDIVVTTNEKNEFTLFTGKEAVQKGSEDAFIFLYYLNSNLRLTLFFYSTLVSSKADTTTINDIKLIGIFDLYTVETIIAKDYFNIPINSPSYPMIVPRFNSLADLTSRMSQVVSNFTNIPTTITAEYHSATDQEDGKFILGIQVEKAFQNEVSFSSSLSLGDFSTLTVDQSSLVIGGALEVYHEFGIILGADDTESLKIVGEINATSCESSSFAFNITLYHDDDDPITHTLGMTTCSEEGIEARKNALNNVVSAALNGDATVSIVGTSSLVLAFDPYWTEVKTVVPYAYRNNIYGLSNDTQKKASFQFANGLTWLEASLSISGSADVSATVLDSIEVGASITSAVIGSLQFDAGTKGQLIPFDTWLSNMRSLTDPTDPFHDPEFAQASISLDGSFSATVELREPFQFDTPSSFTGSFAAPYEVNLLNVTAVGSTQPNVIFDIDLPNIGDIRNLSFGGKFTWS